MSAQVVLIIAGLTFIAAAIAGGGNFVKVILPNLSVWARIISAGVGIAAFALGLAPSIYTANTGVSNEGNSYTPQASTPTPAGTAIVPGYVSIDQPAYGAKVGERAVFSGKANLPPGETLVLSAENLSDRSRTLYLEAVNDWRRSQALSHWIGCQYLGSGDSSIGQTFEVSVIAMKTHTVTAALAEPANRPTWHVKSLPDGSEVKQTLRVVRVKGTGPAVCH